jgi:hypothetical protein
VKERFEARPRSPAPIDLCQAGRGAAGPTHVAPGWTLIPTTSPLWPWPPIPRHRRAARRRATTIGGRLKLLMSHRSSDQGSLVRSRSLVVGPPRQTCHPHTRISHAADPPPAPPAPSAPSGVSCLVAQVQRAGCVKGANQVEVDGPPSRTSSSRGDLVRNGGGPVAKEPLQRGFLDELQSTVRPVLAGWARATHCTSGGASPAWT